MLLAATVLLSAFSGVAMGAQPAIDTDDADGNGVSDYADGDTVVYNESANASYIQFTADSENAEVSIEGPNGTEVYSNASAEVVESASNTYRVAVHPTDDFDDLEVGGGENVTLSGTIVNDTTAANPDTLSFTLYYQNTDEQATIVIDDADADSSIVSFGTLGVSQYVPFMGSDVKSAAIEETIGIDGTNTTTATFAVSNGSVEDSVSESVGESDDGAWLPDAYAKANGHFIPVFAESNPDVDWLDTSEDAYAVADADGNSVTVHNLDAVTSDSDTEVEFKLHANEKMGFWNAKSMFNDLGMDATSWSFNALKAFSIPML